VNIATSVLIGVVLGVFPAQTFEVPIAVRTQERNPVILRGFVQAVTKKNPEGKIFPSFELRGSITNTSLREIVLVIATFDVKNLNYANQAITENRDYFFDAELLKPNAVSSFEETGLPYGMSKFESVPMPASGKVTGRVSFVQFAGGESWGDHAAAVYALRTRAAALEKMQALKVAYETEGTDRFMSELKSSAEVPFVSSVYMAYQRENSVSAAYQKLISMLQAASLHLEK
jgi:hypothetical protein